MSFSNSSRRKGSRALKKEKGVWGSQVVEKFLEGQATVPEKVPEGHPHGPLHIAKPGLGGRREQDGSALGPE